MVRAICRVQYGIVVDFGFRLSYGSVRYAEQCIIVQSCIDEGGWSCLKKSIRV